MSNMNKNNQKGMVSIIVTMIMLLVITLIVVGFAQVSRRNQREALDRQLSTQAYYAAESGVNAALQAINAQLGNSSSPINPANLTTGASTNSQCNGAGSFILQANLSNKSQLNGTNVTYTCLLVNANTDSLVADAPRSQSTVLFVNPSPATANLNITWNSSSSNMAGLASCNYSPGSAGFTTTTAWNCPYGVLRVDLYRNSSSASTSAQNMAAATDSLYLIPTQNGTSTQALTYDGSAHGYIIPVACNSSHCTTTLTLSGGAKFGASGESYYARLSSYYGDAKSVTITGDNGVTFPGSQLVIDATGKAQDELRRIQVRVPLSGAPGDTPSYALQTTDSICKQLQTPAYADSCH